MPERLLVADVGQASLQCARHLQRVNPEHGQRQRDEEAHEQHDDPWLLEECLRRLFEDEYEDCAGGSVGERHSLRVREREREAARGCHLVALADDDSREDRDHRAARRE